MEDNSLKQIKEDKAALAGTIDKLLNKFTDKYGCEVEITNNALVIQNLKGDMLITNMVIISISI